ncbi:hypothetical protein REPUB_Repub02eG0110100 [Reevesia pubescens]
MSIPSVLTINIRGSSYKIPVIVEEFLNESQFRDDDSSDDFDNSSASKEEHHRVDDERNKDWVTCEPREGDKDEV